MNMNKYERIRMNVNKITNEKAYEITNEIRMNTMGANFFSLLKYKRNMNKYERIQMTVNKISKDKRTVRNYECNMEEHACG